MTLKNSSPAVVLFIMMLMSLRAGIAFGNEYIGARKCAPCHERESQEWNASGHARILRKVSDVDVGDIPLPDGLKRKDVSYVIGGYRWKALFLDSKGYLVTSTSLGKGKNQYNLGSRKWRDYLAGKKVPYDCGKCHTTGYSPEGHQEGLAGIVGTWRFDGVQCEACHGPGSLHASSTRKEDIRTDRDICSQCHGRSPYDMIPLRGAFLEGYTEANQLAKSRKKDFACTECHDPHRSAKESIKQTCEKCHPKIAERYKRSYMYKAGVLCIDCHMPPAGIVAEGDEKTFRGDVMSHLFKIDHRKEFPAVVEEGQTVNAGYLSVDYTCMRCHSLYGTRQWATTFAMFAHRIKITTDIKIMRLQIAFSYVGIFSVLVALLSALSLKNWLWPSLDKKRMASIHRHSAWISFSIYTFVSSLCIFFHFPLGEPVKVIEMGWFLIHPLNGALGLIIYGGKVLSVRKFKTAWKSPGLVWGAWLSVFWLIQFITAALLFFNIAAV